MTLPPSGIRFAISSADDATTQRASKQAQRELAAKAERRLMADHVDREVAAGVWSRAHSRRVAVVAASWETPQAPRGVSALGADVEFCDPRRRWREIAFTISELEYMHDARPACRAWTLCEAWYKALGVWPVPALVRRALRLDALVGADAVIALAASIYWMRFEPVEAFQASLVWRGALLTPVLLGADSDPSVDATSGSPP